MVLTDRYKALIKLQETDSSIDLLKSEMESMPESTRLVETEAKLKRISGELDEAAGKVAGLEHMQKKLEDESSRLDVKIKGEEEKLYAGTIGNPKELMALQHEIEVLTSEKDDIDTRFLVGEDDLKDAKSNEAILRAEEENLKKERAHLSETVGNKLNDFNEKISKLEKDRKEPTGLLDELSLKIYDQMRVKGRGVAVVAAKEGVCGGCHLENSEDSGHGASDGPLRRCEYCHRILITS